MSKFDEMIEKYQVALATQSKDAVDSALLTAVTKGLGPSIYLKDASLVSCSDKTELDRVKTNFLSKKLGVEGEAADNAIKAVCAEYDARMKYRAVFYYMLAKKLGKTL